MRRIYDAINGACLGARKKSTGEQTTNKDGVKPDCPLRKQLATSYSGRGFTEFSCARLISRKRVAAGNAR